jgi:hypothetical protein
VLSVLSVAKNTGGGVRENNESEQFAEKIAFNCSDKFFYEKYPRLR